MSKRELRKYLRELKKEDLEKQVIDLYERFKPVKVFYDFVFNPKEEELLQKAKYKISKEYFPKTNRKPKARRSIAQKEIRHFRQLGVDPYITADLMLYNIEIAQIFSEEQKTLNEAFCKSILKSYEEATKYITENGITSAFRSRIVKIAITAEKQNWRNKYLFEKIEIQFQDFS
ncbi:MAG TPA: DUF6155 family protein [Flavobacteriaceae bacterium]|nr:DUF6155 family protein [Flavobacteriaceae bacterium]